MGGGVKIHVSRFLLITTCKGGGYACSPLKFISVYVYSEPHSQFLQLTPYNIHSKTVLKHKVQKPLKKT